MNNLKPIRTTERAKRLGKLGGQTKSPRKALASRINGLLANKVLTPEQRYMLSLLKERRFIDLISELISMSLEEVNNPVRRDKVIDQLLRFLPQKNINLDLNPKTNWNEILGNCKVNIVNPNLEISEEAKEFEKQKINPLQQKEGQ